MTKSTMTLPERLGKSADADLLREMIGFATQRLMEQGVVRGYVRRAGHIDRMILACFALGPSTRKVAAAPFLIFGWRVSAGTVSQVAKTLDGAVAASHRRPLKDVCAVPMLDCASGGNAAIYAI